MNERTALRDLCIALAQEAVTWDRMAVESREQAGQQFKDSPKQKGLFLRAKLAGKFSESLRDMLWNRREFLMEEFGTEHWDEVAAFERTNAGRAGA